jgi:hypothetical protein
MLYSYSYSTFNDPITATSDVVIKVRCEKKWTAAMTMKNCNILREIQPTKNKILWKSDYSSSNNNRNFSSKRNAMSQQWQKIDLSSLLCCCLSFSLLFFATWDLLKNVLNENIAYTQIPLLITFHIIKTASSPWDDIQLQM